MGSHIGCPFHIGGNMEQTVEKNNEKFSKKIGNTTYQVTVHFAENTTRTFADSVKTLIKNECDEELRNIHASP